MDNNIITETRVASMDDLVPLFKESLSQGRSVKFKPKGISMITESTCFTVSSKQGRLIL